MKLSRRKLFGAAAGAAVATQMDSTSVKSNWAPEPGYSSLNEARQQIANVGAPKQDPDYFINKIKDLKKIISGDFSGREYEFEDNIRGRMYANVECLKSISATARQHFLETGENKRRKRQLIENAKKELDRILGMPFSITGLLFDE